MDRYSRGKNTQKSQKKIKSFQKNAFNYQNEFTLPNLQKKVQQGWANEYGLSSSTG